jgi:hypothetical protein
MVNPPVLSLPDLNKPFIVETNMSGSGIGAMLMLEGHHIAYVSKALEPKQQALSTYERERDVGYSTSSNQMETIFVGKTL